MLAGLSLSGCQSAPELLAGDEYPPEYAEGFRAGCGSGRQAAGRLASFARTCRVI